MNEEAADTAPVLVAMVLGRHRLTGEVRMAGAPRRLVDILNGLETHYLQLHEGTLEDLLAEAQEPQAFSLAQVHLDSILFAAPRGNAQLKGNAFEVVRKVPIAARVVLPGFQISGNVFVLPDGQRPAGPILGSRRFAPLADASIVPVEGPCRVWREPIVVVNLTRAILCLPQSGGSAEAAPASPVPHPFMPSPSDPTDPLTL